MQKYGIKFKEAKFSLLKFIIDIEIQNLFEFFFGKLENIEPSITNTTQKWVKH